MPSGWKKHASGGSKREKSGGGKYGERTKKKNNGGKQREPTAREKRISLQAKENAEKPKAAKWKTPEELAEERWDATKNSWRRGKKKNIRHWTNMNYKSGGRWLGRTYRYPTLQGDFNKQFRHQTSYKIPQYIYSKEQKVKPSRRGYWDPRDWNDDGTPRDDGQNDWNDDGTPRDDGQNEAEVTTKKTTEPSFVYNNKRYVRVAMESNHTGGAKYMHEENQREAEEDETAAMNTALTPSLKRALSEEGRLLMKDAFVFVDSTSAAQDDDAVESAVGGSLPVCLPSDESDNDWVLL